MSETLVFACWAIVVFMALLPVVKLEWAFLAYLTSFHLKIASEGFESAVSLGATTVVTAVFIPTVLLFRCGSRPLKFAMRTSLFRIWLVFCVYVVVASLWSPFPLSAVKQVGYLYTYTVTCLIAFHLYMTRPQKLEKVVVYAVGLAIFAGLLSLVIEGDSQGIGRFSSFTAAQNFGLFLGIALIYLLSVRHRTPVRSGQFRMVITLTVVALIANGSRQGAVAGLMSIPVLWYAAGRRSVQRLGIVCSIIALSVVLVAGAFQLADRGVFSRAAESSRLFAVLDVATKQRGSFRDIGTIRFRQDMYAAVLEEILDRPPLPLLFGSGTSASGDLIANGTVRYRNYDRYTVDANRVVHNEMLRALYEWGIVGGVLFTAVLVALFRLALSIGTSSLKSGSLLLAYAFAVIFGAFSLLGNLLSASAGPQGALISIVVARASWLWVQENGERVSASAEDGRVRMRGGNIAVGTSA